MATIDFIEELHDGSIEITARRHENGAGEVFSFKPKHDLFWYKVPFSADYGNFSGLSKLSLSYKKTRSYLIVNFRQRIVSLPRSAMLTLFLETLFLLRILFNWNIDKSADHYKRGSALKAAAIIVEAVITIPHDIMLRLSYYLTNGVMKKVWLMRDRGMSAGDNAEALFRYTQTVNNPNISIYFAISKKSPDYVKMKSIGKVVKTESFKYKLLVLIADKIISSHADIETTNPFFRRRNRFTDLMDFDFIFLQHGVIRHDLSGWLNKYEKNIKLFVTSAKNEYDSILELPYHYSKSNLLLSGMPRFDYLQNNIKKKIILAPTYRSSLLKTKTDMNGARPYDDKFKYSDYFQFYNDLINDRKLIQKLKASGYTIEFLIHPNFEKQRIDFIGNDQVNLPPYPYDYKKYISEGALLVSDYSSVSIDFAYLLKPVIYVKFDEDEFYKSQTYDQSSFYNDEDNGFGVVVKDKFSLVDEIISCIEDDCVMKDVYKERANSFFHKIDKNNSMRVYDAIISL